MMDMMTSNIPTLSYVTASFPPQQPAIIAFSFDNNNDSAASYESNLSLSFAPNVSKPSAATQPPLKKSHRKTPPSSNKHKQSAEKQAASALEKQSIPLTASAVVKSKTSFGTNCNVADIDDLVGSTPLAEIFVDEDERFHVVLYLLETGAFTNQQTLREFANDHPKVIQLLLELNVDLGFDHLEYWRPSALAIAAADSFPDRNQNFRLFLNSGMDLQMLSTMEAALKGGIVDKVHQLLDRGFDLSMRDAFTEDQPLHLACQHKHCVDKVRLLIEFGAPKYSRNRRGETALNVALTYNCPEIAKYLEEVGIRCSSNAIISFLQLSKGKGQLVMSHISVMPPTTSKEAMMEVIQYVVEQGGEIDKDALFELVKPHYEPLLAWLIELGADLSNDTDNCSVLSCIDKRLSSHLQTFLWYGMDFGSYEVLSYTIQKGYLPGLVTLLDRLLLPDNDYDSHFLQMLFDQAVKDRSWTIVRMLIKAGVDADTINQCDKLQKWSGADDLFSFDVFRSLVSKGLRFKQLNQLR